MTQTAKITIARQKVPALDYLVDEDICVGQIVIAPFRNEEVLGIVTEIGIESKYKNLKNIIGPLEPNFILPSNMLKLIQIAANYYFAEAGTVAKMVLPVNLAGLEPKIIQQNLDNTNLLELTEDQIKSLTHINTKEGTTLLHGATGSGKTEIYFHMILEKVAKECKQALFLLPEISLSKQILKRFEERFGTKAAIWNASVTKAQKIKLMASIMSGDVQIVIGARSALFLPFKDLGIIIVDEEHDTSYKQEDTIPYNARDMAVMRGSLAKIPVILGSATPSLESFYNAKNGKYKYVELKSRFGSANLPQIHPIDMKRTKKGRYISDKLYEAIKAGIDKGEQSMLFLNRKGYSPFILCNFCGYKPECSNCSSALVYHKESAKLICHHCGSFAKHFTKCPECKEEESMVPCGPGIERINEEVEKLFPEARIQLMTKEDMNSNKKSLQIIEDITAGNVDIIIGTQIITKGYHFPKLTIVGVIDTDIALTNSDLRTAENSFALMHQLTGRAGREDIQGSIYMQTYYPNSSFIKLLQNHDLQGFIDSELQSRIDTNMPPIYKMASLILSDKNELKIKRIASDIARSLKHDDKITILGPSPALMLKKKNQYRYRILFIAKNHKELHSYLSKTLVALDPAIKRNIRIDVDPYDFG